MRLPRIGGLIERRLLLNFRVDPEALESILPDPFEPLIVNDVGIAGICLIRLTHLRPPGVPRAFGMSSENAAHRVAVRLPDGTEGVYIPRRDTNSRLNTVIGGRLFPGAHHHARFQVIDTGDLIKLAMRSDDGQTQVQVEGHSGIQLEPSSVFLDLDSVSSFFEQGSVGYSATSDSNRFDTLRLKTRDWRVTPLTVQHVSSSFFDDSNLFPVGTVEFDNALIMRGIEHEWESGDSLYCAETVDLDRSDP
jgi:hypothetical protein